MRKINNLKTTAILAMLCAISIVAGKYLAIRGGDVMRFSLENMPIIFAGTAFGPVAGALVGLVADLVGCLMVGYAINPIVTLGAVVIGVISGLAPIFMDKITKKKWLITAVTVAIAHLIGSVVIKTIGLAIYYTMPFEELMLWRALNYLIVGIIDGVIVHALINNKGILMHINKYRMKKNDDVYRGY